MTERIDRLDLGYTLTFESAFHCGSGLPRLLIDRAVRRDAEGYLFVPGATVKGALRDCCEQIARVFGLEARSPHDENAALGEYTARDSLSRLFGSRLHPGQLFIDDLEMQGADRNFLGSSLSLQTSERTQVSLSRRTGAAKPKMLFSSELGLTDLRFEGGIYGYISDVPINDRPDSPTFAEVLLVAGLMSMDRIGGNKSTGIGRCRMEVVSLSVNGQSHDPADWLESLADLEYADLVRAETQA
jgi:CRISPR/Cas system CSM-associated protein Csm3 (group 7 of RAMP superfamily)